MPWIVPRWGRDVEVWGSGCGGGGEQEEKRELCPGGRRIQPTTFTPQSNAEVEKRCGFPCSSHYVNDYYLEAN